MLSASLKFCGSKIVLEFQPNFDRVLLTPRDIVKHSSFVPPPIENGIEQIILIFLNHLSFNQSFAL